jgi:hypothetical protein
MSGLVDFDAFRSEQKAEPVQLRIGGQVYDLPPALPAALALDIIRLQDEGGNDADVPVAKLEEFGRQLFGGDLFRTVIETHSITLPELPELMRQVLAAYDTGAVPNRAARRTKRRASRSRS